MFFLTAAFALLSTMGIKTYYGDIKTAWVWGIDDIRWGIDIRGGVNVTFGASDEYASDHSITQDDLNAAKSMIELRLVNKNINDYEVYTDIATGVIIVQFPWQSGDNSFDPEQAVNEIGATAKLTFREKHEVDEDGLPTGDTENVILEGKHVKKATALYNSEDKEYFVRLELNDEGAQLFSDATERLLNDTISIWMDDVCISHPTVSAHITDGTAVISGSFTAD